MKERECRGREKVKVEKKTNKKIFTFLRRALDDKAHRIKKKTSFFFSFIPFSASRPFAQRERVFVCPSARLRKQTAGKTPALSDKYSTMTEAFDTRELAAALDDDDAKLTINDLPKELLVSIFIAVENQTWARHTVPPLSGKNGLSSAARRMRALCTRRSRSTFERSSKSQRRGRWGPALALKNRGAAASGLVTTLSAPRGSSHGSRGAPARCASCASQGGGGCMNTLENFTSEDWRECFSLCLWREERERERERERESVNEKESAGEREKLFFHRFSLPFFCYSLPPLSLNAVVLPAVVLREQAVDVRRRVASVSVTSRETRSGGTTSSCGDKTWGRPQVAAAAAAAAAEAVEEEEEDEEEAATPGRVAPPSLPSSSPELLLPSATQIASALAASTDAFVGAACATGRLA